MYKTKFIIYVKDCLFYMDKTFFCEIDQIHEPRSLAILKFLWSIIFTFKNHYLHLAMNFCI